MEKGKSFLTAFNLIAAAAICNWGTIFYSVHTLDWFLILWPVVPTILMIIAVAYMPRENTVNENDFKDSVRLSVSDAVLKRYELWEAKLIKEDKCWEGGMPELTSELFEELLEIQALRNKALENEA